MYGGSSIARAPSSGGFHPFGGGHSSGAYNYGGGSYKAPKDPSSAMAVAGTRSMAEEAVGTRLPKRRTSAAVAAEEDFGGGGHSSGGHLAAVTPVAVTAASTTEMGWRLLS